MNSKILLCTAVLALPSVAFTQTAQTTSASEQLKPLNNVRVSMQRMLRSTDGRYFLDIYAGIWNPHGSLYDQTRATSYALKGTQKADQINLLAVSAEGMATPNNETLNGTLNANTGIMQASWNTSAAKTSLNFEPAFKASDKPVVVFKFYGVDNAQYPSGKILKQVDVIDKNSNKLLQSLTGFTAFANSIGYMDVNFDGYYDVVLSDVSDGKKIEDKRFIYWMFNPKTHQFQRSAQLDALVGFPRLRGDKQQIDFGEGQLFQVKDGLMYRIQ